MQIKNLSAIVTFVMKGQFITYASKRNYSASQGPFLFMGLGKTKHMSLLHYQNDKILN